MFMPIPPKFDIVFYYAVFPGIKCDMPPERGPYYACTTPPIFPLLIFEPVCIPESIAALLFLPSPYLPPFIFKP